MPEPFEKFRYSECGTSSHYMQPIVLCLWLPLLFELELQFCLAAGAVGAISLETAVGYLKIWFRTSLVELFGPCKNRRTAQFCPVPGLS